VNAKANNDGGEECHSADGPVEEPLLKLHALETRQLPRRDSRQRDPGGGFSSRWTPATTTRRLTTHRRPLQGGPEK
jgi:hypothetical protein